MNDLDYMHARYYSPHLGRFLSVDPMERRDGVSLPQAWNAYSYVTNNPLRYVDPDGLEKIDPIILDLFRNLLSNDYSEVELHLDSIFVPSGFGAITLGEHVFLSKSDSENYRLRNERAITLLAHELAHVQDYRNSGIFGFLDRYVGEFLSGEPYRSLTAERVAQVVENYVAEFLADNDYLSEKIVNGQRLTYKDHLAISIWKEVRLKKLQPGLHVVQGVLIKVESE